MLEKLLGKVGEGEELTPTQKQQTQRAECSGKSTLLFPEACWGSQPTCIMNRIGFESRGAVSFSKLEEAGIRREALVESLSHSGNMLATFVFWMKNLKTQICRFINLHLQ